jgi:hypothetical protein
VEAYTRLSLSPGGEFSLKTTNLSLDFRAALADKGSLILLSLGCMQDQSVTLQPGDELRVDRGAYHHHACYVGNGAVVQFGGRIKDKRHALIHYASISDFRKGAQVKVVPHDDLDRAAAVRRARWLVENPPPTTYHVFGYNCEHVAHWCATGKIECRQAKDAFTLNSLIGGAVFAFLDHPNGWLIGLVQLLAGLFLAWLSRGSTRKFEQHIRANWTG